MIDPQQGTTACLQPGYGNETNRYQNISIPHVGSLPPAGNLPFTNIPTNVRTSSSRSHLQPVPPSFDVVLTLSHARRRATCGKVDKTVDKRSVAHILALLYNLAMTPSEMGKKGAAITNAKLTPEQRSAAAKKGWERRKKKLEDDKQEENE